MTSSNGTILRVLRVLAHGLEPLERFLADATSAQSFLLDLGLRLPAVPPSILQLRAPVVQLDKALASLENVLATADEASAAAVQGLHDAIAALATISAVLARLPTLLEKELATYPDALAEVNAVEFVECLGSRLVCDYVKTRHPALYNTAVLLGIIENEVEGAGVNYELAHAHERVQWSRIADWFQDPQGILGALYRWGAPDLDYALLLERLQYVLLAVGYRTLLVAPESKDDSAPTDLAPARELHLPVYSENREDGTAKLDVILVPLGFGTSTAGLGIVMSASGLTNVELQLAPNAMLELAGRVETSGGFGLGVQPPFDVHCFVGEAASSSVSGVFAARLNLGRADREPVYVLVQPALLSVSIAGIALKLTVDVSTVSDSSVGFEARLLDGLLVIGGSSADGFLSRILPPEGIRAPFDLGIGWRSGQGVHLVGSGGIEVDIPLHASFGPLEIETLHAGLGIDPTPTLRAELGVSAAFALGPVSGSVKRIGVKALLSFPGKYSGNLGDAHLGFEFRAPSGAGLALTAGPITGGGFLDFDEPNGLYSGVLSLQIYEIGLVAIALITTKLPDGSKGYSLLINISVQFAPPIQLTFGFTLVGVGGLVGINRTMDIEALQRGVRQGTLESILFPDPAHVIENAAQIISDMRTVFPAAEGRVVIGPMVKIGWGTPQIITADIGIFLELPAPVRIALMGRLSASLPSPDKALVAIHLDILGVLDLEKKELTFQASLYDSHILTFALSGDAAFLLNWGDQPQFALSLGGFHPKFPTPAPAVIFADMKRLTLALSSGKSLQLTCSTYTAITPNSIQFGAHADLYATAMGATIRGYLGFDALFYLSPFSFEVQISAGVSIKYKGVSLCDVGLSLLLSGPTPWVARGSAKIKVLFFSVKVNFCITWGSRDVATLPAVDPWEELQKALVAPESWGSALPAGRELVESLRNTDESEGPQLVVHPAGQLEVRQTVAPLWTNLSKAGNVPITGHDRFEIHELIVDGNQLPTEHVEEFFARGQFEDLSPAKKLAVPAFERMPAGVRTSGSTAVRCDGEAEAATLAYESILIDADRTSTTQPSSGNAHWEDAQAFIAAESRRRAVRRSGPRSRYTASETRSKARVRDERFAIVDARTLERAPLKSGGAAQTNANLTRLHAEQLLQDELALNSGRADQLMIVPEYQVREKAA